MTAHIEELKTRKDVAERSRTAVDEMRGEYAAIDVFGTARDIFERILLTRKTSEMSEYMRGSIYRLIYTTIGRAHT